jgi:hypothetical protein
MTYRSGPLNEPERGPCGRLHAGERADEVDGGVEPLEVGLHSLQSLPKQRAFLVAVV